MNMVVATRYKAASGQLFTIFHDLRRKTLQDKERKRWKTQAEERVTGKNGSRHEGRIKRER